MMTLEAAMQSVLSLLEKRGVGGKDGIRIIEEKTLEKPYGWAFFYNSKRFLDTGDIIHSLIGAGPVVVIAETEAIYELGGARTATEQLAELEKKLGL